MSSERTDRSDTKAGASGGGSRTARGKHGKQASDPDALAAEIEQTREDLAVTLDEIADRVSPKRVAERGKSRAREVFAERSAQAKELYAEKSAQAKELMAEKTAVAKDKAATAQAAVSEKTAQARGAAAARTGRGSSGTNVDDLPPVTGVAVPRLAPDRPTPGTDPLPSATTRGGGGSTAVPSSSTAGGASTWISQNPTASTELAAGAAVALVGLWLVRRRRS
ncbi:MAG: DUF3618 domain-containing protein [Actinomycetota bacterium]|nr:DUF3618 domain-containing protein [Actinomycetota bacterium]